LTQESTERNFHVGFVNLVCNGYYGGFNEYCPSEIFLNGKKNQDNPYGRSYYNPRNYTETLSLPNCFEEGKHINCIGHFYSSTNILLVSKILSGKFTIFSYDCFASKDIEKLKTELPTYLKIINKFNPDMKISIIIRVNQAAIYDFKKNNVLENIRKFLNDKFNFIEDVEAYDYVYNSSYHDLVARKKSFIKIIENFFKKYPDEYIRFGFGESKSLSDIFSRDFTRRKYVFSRKYMEDVCAWNGVKDVDGFLSKISSCGYFNNFLPGLYFKCDGTPLSMMTILKKIFDCRPIYKSTKTSRASIAHYNLVDTYDLDNIFTKSIRKEYKLVERLVMKILRKNHLGKSLTGNNKTLYIRKYSYSDIDSFSNNKVKYVKL